MSKAIDLLLGGASYVRRHPLFLLQAARNAARLDVTVPLDLLRWAIDQLPKGKGPERIELHASPPALGLQLVVDLFGTKLDVSTNVTVEAIENRGEDGLTVALRVRDLQVDAPPQSPAAMMLKSFDLTKPGQLMSMMPQRPPMLTEAKDDLFVFDLLKVKQIGGNAMVRRALHVLSDVLHVRDLRTDGDLLVLGLGVNLRALPSALARLRS